MVTKKKYPRTPHLPFSLSSTSDDVHEKDFKFLKPGSIAVVTEKMDGENSTLYRDGLHARSTSSTNHESRSYLTALHVGIKHQIPENCRLIVENVYAAHSLHYDNLEAFQYGIGVVEEIDGISRFLDWDSTEKIFNDLGIPTVPVLYVGKVDLKTLEEIFSAQDHSKAEGIVVRSFNSFNEDEFSVNVGKAVRDGHVQTDDSWTRNWKKNSLA